MITALIIVIAILLITVGVLWKQAKTTVKYNEGVEQQNQALHNENEYLKQQNVSLGQIYQDLSFQNQQEEGKLASLRELIKTQDNILRSLSSSAENMRRGAEEQAQSVYESRLAALEKDYAEKKKQIDDKMARESLALLNQIEAERDKLKDLECKQLAYLEAKRREEEMQAKRDYYRLVLDTQDIADITLLRNIQAQLAKKDSIDKIIYETYYRQPYDVLMSHLFDNNGKICGIYKITCIENDQAYIGQSVDIRERFRQHIKSSLTNGPTPNKLYQHMKKYGPENFTFEILEIVSRDKLNERETYWIDFYKTKEYGLNSTKGGA